MSGLMKVLGVVWLGSRTRKFDELSRMFSKTMGMRILHHEEGMSVFRAEDGDLIEVFGMDHNDVRFFPTAPVAGFLVEDIEKGREELMTDGIRCGEVEGDGRGNKWMHFVAPDGNMYQLNEHSRKK